MSNAKNTKKATVKNVTVNTVNDTLDSIIAYVDCLLNTKDVMQNFTSRWSVEYANLCNNQICRVYDFNKRTHVEMWSHVAKDDATKIVKNEFCVSTVIYESLKDFLDANNYKVTFHAKDALKYHIKKCDNASTQKLIDEIRKIFESMQKALDDKATEQKAN